MSNAQRQITPQREARAFKRSAAGSSQPRLQTRNKHVLLLLDLSFLFVLGGFFLFWNLGSPSLRVPDEVAEVGAGQEMAMSGSWLLPTLDGKPFFDKPPFKMWLSALSAALLGPSNFSYRFVDAASGLATLLLLYFFGRVLFHSRLPGLIAVFAMLGSDVYMLLHGARTAVQDSLLLFLSCAAMLAAWKIYEPAFEETPRKTNGEGLGWAVFGGLCTAAAIMTKSAGGLIAPICILAFLLLSGSPRSLFRRMKGPLLTAAGISLLLPAVFFVGHSLFTPGAFSGMLYHHVYARAVQGYHNVAGPEFYFIRLFEQGMALPPILLAAALIFGAHGSRRDLRLRFLSVWAFAPVLLYTLVRTKLSWYILPSIPATALLLGELLRRVEAFTLPRWAAFCKRGAPMRLRDIFGALIFAGSLVLLGSNAYAVAASILKEPKRIELDYAAEALLALKEEQGSLQLAAWKLPPLALREKPYGNILSPFLIEVAESQMHKRLEQQTIDAVLTSMSSLPPLLSRSGALRYKILRPIWNRNSWLAIISYRDSPALSGFSSAKRIFDFGSPKLPVLFGLHEPSTMDQLGVRLSNGDKAAILIKGDPLLRQLGTKQFLNIAVHGSPPGSRPKINVYLNDLRVAELQAAANQLATQRFSVPPDVWKDGDNMLLFSLEGELSGEERMLFNWLSVRLAQAENEIQ